MRLYKSGLLLHLRGVSCFALAAIYLIKCRWVLTCKGSSELDASKCFVCQTVNFWGFWTRWSLATIQLCHCIRKANVTVCKLNEREGVPIKLYSTTHKQTKTSDSFGFGPWSNSLLTPLKEDFLRSEMPRPLRRTTARQPQVVRRPAWHSRELQPWLLGPRACST